MPFRHTITRRAVLVVVGAAVIAIGSIGTALALKETNGGVTEVKPPDPGPPATKIPDDLRAKMGVFRRPQTDGDQPPGDSLKAIAQSGDSEPGENPTLARQVRDDQSGDSGYLWPTNDGVCVSVENASSCAQLADLEKAGGVGAITIVTPDGTRVAGFALDGVSTVDLKTAQGDEQQVAVSDNFFSAAVKGDPTEATWKDEEGGHMIQLPGRRR